MPGTAPDALIYYKIYNFPELNDEHEKIPCYAASQTTPENCGE